MTQRKIVLIMKYYISKLIVLLLYFSTSNAQTNLIYNAGFESHKSGESYPSGVAQADKLANWLSNIEFANDDNSLHFHSCDWKHSSGTNLGSHTPYVISTLSGNGSLGMGTYELIQQKFNNEGMNPGQTYYFSMYIYLSPEGVLWNTTETKLRIMVAKNRIHYQNEDGQSEILCTENYIELEDGLAQDIDEVANFDINPQTYSIGAWHRISFSWVAPTNIDQFDYIGFHMTREDFDPSSNGSFECFAGYIGIDNVRFSSVDYEFCGAYCSPNLGAISHNPNLPNVIVASETPWMILVENAIGIDFTLWDGFGAPVYSQSAFDVNGLIDAGYTDYLFAWVGELPDGTSLPEDGYNYTLKLWNCNEEINLIGSITYLNGDDVQNQIPDTYNSDLENCCLDELYIQNTQFNNIHLESATNFIHAGSNVTNQQTNGPVLINAGSSVRFVSQAVELFPGVDIDDGADFEIVIDECIYAHLRMGKRLRPEYKYRSLIINDSRIFPNPSKGIFIIEGKEIIHLVEIFDMYGKLVLSVSNLSERKSKIDLTSLKNGVYIIKIYESGFSWTEKLMLEK